MIDGVYIPPFHLMLQYSVLDIIHLSHWDFSPTPSTLLWILDSWSLWASSMGPLALWPPVGGANGTHQQESGGWDETSHLPPWQSQEIDCLPLPRATVPVWRVSPHSCLLRALATTLTCPFSPRWWQWLPVATVPEGLEDPLLLFLNTCHNFVNSLFIKLFSIYTVCICPLFLLGSWKIHILILAS